MKKVFTIFIFLIAFTSTALSQETNVAAKRKGLLSPYFSVFYRAEGLSYFRKSGSTKSYTDFVSTLGFSANIGKELFFTAEFGGLLGDSLFGWSFGGGLGYYIFDKRDSLRHGSSLKISLIYSGKILFDERLGTEFDETYGTLIGYLSHMSDKSVRAHGASILLNYDYNFYKNFALRVGFNLSGYGVVMGNNGGSISRIGESKGGMLSYGLSIGLAF